MYVHSYSLIELDLDISDCEPSADFSFSSDFEDASKEMVYAGTSNVLVQGGSAVFAGDGMVNLYRFANAEFRSDLVISFGFEASGMGKLLVSLNVYVANF